MTAVKSTVMHTPGQAAYEYRLDLVTGVLQKQTGLDAPAARETAVLVLRAINTIPEHVR
ncbi:MAG: DUF6307 family protein [Nakamurella sp.]